MRSEFLQLVFYVIAVVVGGACEEFLPRVFGVGAPVLMTLVVSVATRRPAVVAVLVALVAGAFEDALSSLPTMTSPCLFLVLAVVVHRAGFARTVLVLAYPLYQVWLMLIVPDLPYSLGVRCLASVPIAAVMAFAVAPSVAWLERRCAVDAA